MKDIQLQQRESRYVVDNLDLKRSDFIGNYLHVDKDHTVKNRSNITKPKNRKKKK